jgi:predicted Fe-Mo cluster-binding NifX family protein
MIKIVHNVETGEISEVELTEEEMAFAKQKDSEAKERFAKELETQQAKAALLEKLGITEDEAKLLLS